MGKRSSKGKLEIPEGVTLEQVLKAALNTPLPKRQSKAKLKNKKQKRDKKEK